MIAPDERGALAQQASSADTRPDAATEGMALGCAWVGFAINAVVIGLGALSFAGGPYSSFRQELWYRYGSIAFLTTGVILPAVALIAGRRSRMAIAASMVLMAVSFLGFLGYALNSGGGV